MGGDGYERGPKGRKDSLRGLSGRRPVPADPELRRLVLGREEPITIRPADLLEPQVEGARQQVRKLGYDPSDDKVLIHLMFPSLAPDYMRGPQPERKDGEKPPPPPAEAPEPPAVPTPDPVRVPAGTQAAEFDVEVDGEVFKVRVSGAGLSVVAAPAASPSGTNSAPAPPRARAGNLIAPRQ